MFRLELSLKLTGSLVWQNSKNPNCFKLSCTCIKQVFGSSACLALLEFNKLWHMFDCVPGDVPKTGVMGSVLAAEIRKGQPTASVTDIAYTLCMVRKQYRLIKGKGGKKKKIKIRPTVKWIHFICQYFACFFVFTYLCVLYLNQLYTLNS